jgi:hypothetical protein
MFIIDTWEACNQNESSTPGKPDNKIVIDTREALKHNSHRHLGSLKTKLSSTPGKHENKIIIDTWEACNQNKSSTPGKPATKINHRHLGSLQPK